MDSSETKRHLNADLIQCRGTNTVTYSDEVKENTSALDEVQQPAALTVQPSPIKFKTPKKLPTKKSKINKE